MELKTILKKIGEKYGQSNVVLMIYPDESGRITEHIHQPYGKLALVYFNDIKDLVSHLWKADNEWFASLSEPSPEEWAIMNKSALELQAQFESENLE